MQYRQLGRSGLAVSVVGLGGNNFGMRIDLPATRAVVDAALECGINFIDSAELYGGGESERMLGEVLKGRRQQVVVATKFGKGGMRLPGMPAGPVSPEAHGSRQYVRHAVEDSLKRLQTDYIDLYYLHFPDPRTPMEETLEALTELVREGKVRYIGTCNHSAWQLVEADWIARTHNLTRFIATQNGYSLLDRGLERDITPAAVKYGLGIIPFFPLANGLLTGKYQRGAAAPEGSRLAARPGSLTDEQFDKLDPIEGYARDRGVSLLQVAIGGLAAQPGVASVISGATRPEQVKANAAAGEWLPSQEDREALDAITKPAPAAAMGGRPAR